MKISHKPAPAVAVMTVDITIDIATSFAHSQKDIAAPNEYIVTFAPI